MEIRLDRKADFSQEIVCEVVSWKSLHKYMIYEFCLNLASLNLVILCFTSFEIMCVIVREMLRNLTGMIELIN